MASCGSVMDREELAMRLRIRRIAVAAAVSAAMAVAPALWAAKAAPAMDPAQALRMLLEGNQRFTAGKPERPNQSRARRTAVVAGQHPIAAILACSDSRTPPEIIFDRGVGDLFVVRVAGNIADEAGIESLAYAVHHLGVRLIMVLGHTHCGAVSAAVAGGAQHELPALMRAIEPAAQAVKGEPGDPVENAIRENVRLMVARLEKAPALEPLAAHGELKIVGAVYDLGSGKVTLVPQRSPAAGAPARAGRVTAGAQ
jgi:carbonic anhydrase